jgi:ABC-type amino acid transport substrate-binding protein
MSTSAKVIIVLLVFLIASSVIASVLVGGLLIKISNDKGLAPVVITGVALDRIRARGELLVGMDTGVPPWAGAPPSYFQNAAGQPDGLDYQLALQLARQLQVPKVKVVHSFYEDLEKNLLQKEDKSSEPFDVAIAGFIPYDAPDVSWSDSYLEFGLCLVVRSDGKVKTTKDLEGKVVGVFDDDAAILEVNRLVKGYAGMEKMTAGYWDMLVSGRIDGFIYDYPFAVAEMQVWYTQNPHRQGTLKIAQYNLTDSSYAVAVRKSEPELVSAVNNAIRSWQESGQYQKDLRTYLGADGLTPAPDGGEGLYVVLEGEDLKKIAKKLLGSEEQWREIWLLNKDRYPNPSLLRAGDRLKVPTRAKPR